MFDVFYIGQKPNQFAHEREVTSIEEAQQLCRTRYFWIIHYLCDYSEFDFLWEPKPWEAHQRHVYASQWQKDSGTALYPKSGWTDTNYHAGMIAIRKSNLDNWEIPDGIENFDYSWHPDPTEPPYDYQFGTQWQKTGGPRYKVTGATATKYVTQDKVQVNVSTRAYVINHGDYNQQGQSELIDVLKDKGLSVVRTTRFISSYQGTLTRLLRQETAEFVWVCSSVCDYRNFDFTWHPESWQGTMLHVFASEFGGRTEKFGDTFLIHVPTFNERIQKTEILEWYDTIHFVDNISVPRTQHHFDIVPTDGNSVVDYVKEHTFYAPLALFSDQRITNKDFPTINLWREKTRTITPLNKGNSVVVVPRDAKTHLFKELYDYPYIDTTYRILENKTPLDVVFISNGEKIAEKNWEHLQQVMREKPNRLLRSDGVNGRVEAYQAAARLTHTPWAFYVFAKLEVNPDFDWSWQPDRMQQNKHYIFHARNPINGLEYGHMAMIAYHRNLTLHNKAQGLDFTLDQEHEVVPVLSGIAKYADDPWTAWRSAFREAIKLKDSEPTIDTEYRLTQWLTKGEGKIGEWSKRGAEDGVAYYEKVNGNFDELRKTYEWKWLSEYFISVYDIEPDQL